MSRQSKIFLGIASFWPLLWFFLVFVFAFFAFLVVVLSGSAYDPSSPWLLLLIIPFHILTIMDIIVLLVVFVIDIVRQAPMDNEKRVLWIAVLLMAAPFAMPAYWYLYIWLGKPEV